jgi:hypothetical protein
LADWRPAANLHLALDTDRLGPKPSGWLSDPRRRLVLGEILATSFGQAGQLGVLGGFGALSADSLRRTPPNLGSYPQAIASQETPPISLLCTNQA